MRPISEGFEDKLSLSIGLEGTLERAGFR